MMDLRGQTDARPYRLEVRHSATQAWDLVQSYGAPGLAKSQAARLFNGQTPYLRIVGPDAEWTCTYGLRGRRRWTRRAG